MKLITKEIENKLPGLYEQEQRVEATGEIIAYVKFFHPDTGWTWYVCGYEPDSRCCYGLVIGFEIEWGIFSLDELEAARGPLGLKVERDKLFRPTPIKDLPGYVSDATEIPERLSGSG